MKNEPKWMIYGAYGYSGELIARQALEEGMRPVLAGRNREKVAALASELDLPAQFFELSDPAAIEEQLQDVEIVLHCAGPFSHTSAPMLAACLKTKTHYLDITGEISVFEHAHAQHNAAAEANIVVCPGVGFDVIPTDALAASLKAALPDATHLQLGFDARAGISAGTAKSSLEGLALGNRARVDGHIQPKPLVYHPKEIDFGNGKKWAMTIPWGDVSTAFYTTEIPNIEVYVPFPRHTIRSARIAGFFTPLLKIRPLQNFLKSRIEKRVKGPSEKRRKSEKVFVWGKVENDRGESKTGYLQTANGYEVTVHGSLGVVKKLLGKKQSPGSYTPTKLMGTTFVSTLPGSSEIKII